MPRSSTLLKIVAVTGAAVVIGASGVGLTRLSAEEHTVEVAKTAPTASTSQLQSARDARVFFGHQSVGANILDGIPAVYSGSGVKAPVVLQTSTAVTQSGGFLAQDYIGTNGDPSSKIKAFTEIINGPLGQQLDVALMKLCYVDITANTDVNAVFAQYSAAMAKLEKAHPDIDFIYTTVPLTTADTGLRNKVKSVVGQTQSTKDNIARQKYNALVRKNFSAKLFDIAKIESTKANGKRTSATSKGQKYYTLNSAWASDNGHLNEAGSQRVAVGLVQAIAAAK